MAICVSLVDVSILTNCSFVCGVASIWLVESHLPLTYVLLCTDDGQSRINDFHAYSFSEKRWSPVLPSATSGNPPSPRDRHVAVAYANNFYVFGGFDGTSRVNDFFSFDFSSMTWREVPVAMGQPPSPRHSHAAVVHNHSMWVFGGYDGSYK